MYIVLPQAALRELRLLPTLRQLQAKGWATRRRSACQSLPAADRPATGSERRLPLLELNPPETV